MGAARSLAPLAPLATVVAVGARTPLGLNARQTAYLHRAGFAAMGEAPLGPEGEPVTVCAQTALDEGLRGSARALALGRPALDEALGGIADARALKARLLLCLDPLEAARAEEARAVAEPLLAVCRRATASCDLALSLRGGAGACFALPGALAALGSGAIDCLVLGGIHSDVDAQAIARLAADGRLYDASHIDAVIAGESAAFVALMTPARASRGGAGLARICGLGQAMEPARLDNDEPAALARALTEAMLGAGAQLEERGLRAGWVLSDLGYESWRVREWQSAFLRASHAILEAPYRVDCPAQGLGSIGAAALPLFVALAAEAFGGGGAPSPIALAVASSEAGERGALLLAAPS